MGRLELVVATFNTHAGIDGYGRRYDLVAACRELEADVLILQEVFAPGRGKSQAVEVAEALGYHSCELPLAPASRIRQALPTAPPGEWEPHRPYPRVKRALRVGGLLGRRHSSEEYEEGSWGIAVLSREDPVEFHEIDLGRLRRDFSRRGALVVELPAGITVVGTHMAHFTHGSPLLFWRLRSALSQISGPAVLGGDMNYWGPPVELALPGWRRAVKAKTWPASAPHHQLDHLLVNRPVDPLEGGAVRAGDSDHLPLRARLGFST